VADQHYGTRENIRALQAQGIRTHMKVIRATGLTEKRGIFHASVFRYEVATDTYRCPANQTLTRRSHDWFQRGWLYRADVNVCRVCPLRSQCTTASIKTKLGRTIVHPDNYELVVKGCEQADSLEAKRDRRRRMTLMEGSFGQASQNHHFKRARWRRLWRQRIQDHLIAAVQNVKKMIAYGPTPVETAAITPKPLPATGSNGRISLQNVSVALETFIRRFLSALMPCFC